MRKLLASGLVCSALLLAQSTLHLRGDNLTAVKAQLLAYEADGRYAREITAAVKPAVAWIETRAAHIAPGEKPAAIFDIDETLLSNWQNMKNCDFCSVTTERKLYPDSHPAAIQPVLDLYKLTRAKGIAAIILTGRYESYRSMTLQDLKLAGYSDWQDLLMRPDGNTEHASVMKARVRADVESKGYKIVLNIGDQLSDLSGGHSERSFKLPNPFYFVE